MSLELETPQLKGHYGPRLKDPQVRCGYLEGERVVYVPLSGAGHGREMIVSADRWAEVASQWGAVWLIVRNGDEERVVSTSPALAKRTGTRFPRLSRLLTGATRKQRVKHRNGDHLDLRDSNLFVVDIHPPRQSKARKARAPRVVETEDRASVVALTPLAKLALGVLKLKLRGRAGAPRSDAAVVEDALCKALDAASEPAEAADGAGKGH
jgi:hypothetical protein